MCIFITMPFTQCMFFYWHEGHTAFFLGKLEDLTVGLWPFLTNTMRYSMMKFMVSDNTNQPDVKGANNDKLTKHWKKN